MTATSPRPAVALPALFAALDEVRTLGPVEGAVLGIAHDSREVRPGGLFVALRGERTDGHDFLAEALARGAVTLLIDEAHASGHDPLPGATTLVVPDTRRALSRLAATFFGDPSAGLSVAGVTGTNGKTTTTQLAQALLAEGGIAAGLIGTLGARFAGASWPLDNTTPFALELQALLGDMRERGARAVVMEVSSHALTQDRVADVRFALAVLTNVTRDHLDFHGTFEAYAGAKRRLFERAASVVLNADDPWGRRWAAELRAAGRSVETYGCAEDAVVRATEIESDLGGSRFRVGSARFHITLPGRFNVENALAALCIARHLGVDDRAAARGLAAFEGVPGRMEHLAGGGVDVLVDYAHTPAALEAVLRALRESARGRLTVVFGCGGDRDRGKRPEMGKIAAELADRVILTSDNPRREEPGSIVAGILAGVADRRHVRVEPDRRGAIRHAILEAAPGDTVLVAGKGHETYQLVGRRVEHLDDREEVRAALAARTASLAP